MGLLATPTGGSGHSNPARPSALPLWAEEISIDGGATQALAVQAGEPEFESPCPHKSEHGCMRL